MNDHENDFLELNINTISTRLYLTSNDILNAQISKLFKQKIKILDKMLANTNSQLKC